VPTPWNDDPSGCEQQILDNVSYVLRDIAGQAGQRTDPTVTMAQDWHRRIYDQVPLPVLYYAGEIRDSDARYPELDGYEVAVGTSPGVPSALVPQALADFEQRAQQAAQQLDAQIPDGSLPSSGGEVMAALILCASLHGEWVRIHPFANGNGRTARLWANWAAQRYGLPAFVSTKPRPPGNPYAVGAMSSMRGNHSPMVAAFRQMLIARLTAGGP
jgi:fido (protein-threonine AMPylation protein)